jgi:histidine ammonia-lyase
MTTSSTDSASSGVLSLGAGHLTVSDVVQLSSGVLQARLDDDAAARMRQSAQVVRDLHSAGEAIYGVTTSVGASVDTAVPPEHASDLSLNIMHMHGCGTGRILDEQESAAVLVLRIASLAQGLSGVRPEIAERLVLFLNARALPCIPAEGSVGASGDLTPLSYLVANLAGLREMHFRGAKRSAADVHTMLGLKPIQLQAKEALAVMNGTSVTAALCCLGVHRALRLARLTASISAMASHMTRSNHAHFDAFLHQARPHPGQMCVARWIREDLHPVPLDSDYHRLQARYSIRCSPHILGVLVDTLRWGIPMLEIELNGVTDNPIVDVERRRIVHGGNFYGGHVGFVCDAMKTAVANVAGMLDRQLLLLCNPDESAGLPRDLVGTAGDDACAHNGFKAVTIAASSLVAEAMKLTIPASAFSRSTELHNQDKVPMATLAARDLLRVLDLSERVAAMMLLACCQAYDLRGETHTGELGRLHQRVRSRVPRVSHDRRMDHDIQAIWTLMAEPGFTSASIELP